MRTACFLLLLVFLTGNTAEAASNPKTDPETAALYTSCAAAANATDKELERNYCYQMISTLVPSLFVTRYYTAGRGAEGSCQVGNLDSVHDEILKIPPVIKNLYTTFYRKEAARSFVALIDSGVTIRDFPLLTSPADRAFAQMLADWDQMPHKTPDDAALQKDHEAQRKIMGGSAFKPDSIDLINSCKNYEQQSAYGRLCHASISGVLVVYALAKSHRLPTYTETDRCYQEKNAFIAEFIKGRHGCFDADTDLKKHAAGYIANRWRPEMETESDSPRSNAPYTAASQLSSLYACRD